VLHNTAQNSSDNLSSYPPDNYHYADVVYWTALFLYPQPVPITFTFNSNSQSLQQPIDWRLGWEYLANWHFYICRISVPLAVIYEIFTHSDWWFCQLRKKSKINIFLWTEYTWKTAKETWQVFKSQQRPDAHVAFIASRHVDASQHGLSQSCVLSINPQSIDQSTGLLRQQSP